jgi:hypothetical protein
MFAYQDYGVKTSPPQVFQGDRVNQLLADAIFQRENGINRLAGFLLELAYYRAVHRMLPLDLARPTYGFFKMLPTPGFYRLQQKLIAALMQLSGADSQAIHDLLMHLENDCQTVIRKSQPMYHELQSANEQIGALTAQLKTAQETIRHHENREIYFQYQLQDTRERRADLSIQNRKLRMAMTDFKELNHGLLDQISEYRKFGSQIEHQEKNISLLKESIEQHIAKSETQDQSTQTATDQEPPLVKPLTESENMHLAELGWHLNFKQYLVEAAETQDRKQREALVKTALQKIFTDLSNHFPVKDPSDHEGVLQTVCNNIAFHADQLKGCEVLTADQPLYTGLSPLLDPAFLKLVWATKDDKNRKELVSAVYEKNVQQFCSRTHPINLGDHESSQLAMMAQKVICQIIKGYIAFALMKKDLIMLATSDEFFAVSMVWEDLRERWKVDEKPKIEPEALFTDELVEKAKAILRETLQDYHAKTDAFNKEATRNRLADFSIRKILDQYAKLIPYEPKDTAEEQFYTLLCHLCLYFEVTKDIAEIGVVHQFLTRLSPMLSTQFLMSLSKEVSKEAEVKLFNAHYKSAIESIVAREIIPLPESILSAPKRTEMIHRLLIALFKPYILKFSDRYGEEVFFSDHPVILTANKVLQKLERVLAELDSTKEMLPPPPLKACVLSRYGYKHKNELLIPEEACYTQFKAILAQYLIRLKETPPHATQSASYAKAILEMLATLITHHYAKNSNPSEYVEIFFGFCDRFDPSREKLPPQHELFAAMLPSFDPDTEISSFYAQNLGLMATNALGYVGSNNFFGLNDKNLNSSELRGIFVVLMIEMYQKHFQLHQKPSLSEHFKTLDLLKDHLLQDHLKQRQYMKNK